MPDKRPGMRLYPGTGAARGGYQPAPQSIAPADVQRPQGTAIVPPACPDCARYRAALYSLRSLRVPPPAAEAIMRVTRDLAPLTAIEVARDRALLRARQLAEACAPYPDLALPCRLFVAALADYEAVSSGDAPTAQEGPC